MVYVGVDRPSLQNSSVVPDPAASRPERARWHFAPLGDAGMAPTYQLATAAPIRMFGVT
jgi:hypothetical protein